MVRETVMLRPRILRKEVPEEHMWEGKDQDGDVLMLYIVEKRKGQEVN